MRKTKEKKTKSKIESLSIFPQKYETYICIGIVLLSLVIFYNEIIFSGKSPNPPDAQNSTRISNSVSDAMIKGIFPLWSPYIFSGMPSYGSLMTTGNRWFDLSKTIWEWTQTYIGVPLFRDGWPIYYYFIFGLSLFLFMLNKGHHKFIAVFSALAIIFSTTVAGYMLDGQPIKIICWSYFPLLLLFLDKIIEKMNWLYAALMVVLAHLIFESTHIQMVVYIYMFLGIYLAYYFVRSIKIKKQLIGVSRGISVLIIVSGIAFAMSADRYLSVWEYNKYSIRGSGPLVTTAESGIKSQTGESGGLSYDYATSWSFSPEEISTFFIPSFYGFGTGQYSGPETNNTTILKHYFGQMPFTSSPNYMGMLVVILAFIGFYYYRKDIFVQALMIISVFSLFVSFGRNLPFLYNLLFHNLPYFDKFRAPVLILIMLHISFAIMAGYGLTAIIGIYKKGNSNKFNKKILYASIVFIVLLFISLAGKGAFDGFYIDVFNSALKTNVENSAAQQLLKAEPNIKQIYYEIYFNNMMKDLTFSLILVSAFFILTYLLLKDFLKPKFYLPLIIILLLVDLWRIDYRPMILSAKKEKAENLKKPDYVEFLEKDKSLFRVLELDNIDNNNMPNTSNALASYKLQNIYGYSPAKMRIYQDVIENCSIVNPFLWNLLNMKYLISNVGYQDSILQVVYAGPGKESFKVMENKKCLPRAFFVNRYEVKDKMFIINSLRDGSFNPIEVAYLESDPGVKVDPVGPEAKANVSGFDLHELNIDVTAPGNNLLFISEIYYPKGWNAYIDGKETSVYKTNYLFRSIIVPPGSHKIEMKFEPSSFYTGKKITLALNAIILCVFGFYGTMYFIKRKKKK